MASNIKEVARAAGVSTATVSRIINNVGYVKEETRKKVLKAIKELNYTPNALARNLSKKETNTVGVIVPDINNPFFGEVIKGISYVADENNLNIILCDTNEDVHREIKALQMLKEQRILGILAVPTSDIDEINNQYLDLLESTGTQIVLIDRDVKHSNFDGIFIDNIKGAFDATNALIKAGHRKIAIIAGPIDSKTGRDRLTGYKNSLLFNKLDIIDRYIFIGDFKFESGYKFAKEIFAMKDCPTAILVCNNLMNLGVIKAVFENQLKIPDDIAIIGFDQTEMFDAVGLKISVVSNPAMEMGKNAIELLLKKSLQKEQHSTNRLFLTPSLILKGSERYVPHQHSER